MKISYKPLLTSAVLIALTACSGSSSHAPRPTLGNPNAKITIEEFSDLQCPACGLVGPQVEEFVRANPDNVRLEFHHFPLPMHEFAFRAAEAAECANNQGKFWEYAKTIFENQKSLSEDFLKKVAEQLKLDLTAFNACLDKDQTKDIVRADLKEGTNRNVSFTPSLYVNGKLVEWTSKEAFEGYIKSLK